MNGIRAGDMAEKLSDLRWTLSEHGLVVVRIIAGCLMSRRMMLPANYTARLALPKPVNMMEKN